jgi:predicted ATPase/DNA-binding SARP family transcriptional activator
MRMSGPLATASRRDAHDTPALLIRLLGGFTITLGEHPVTEDAWRGQKVRALLKLLALAPAQRLARDQLLDMLWPDFTPDAAASNLYSTLTVARKILAGVATLRLRAGMVALYAPGGIRIDVSEFMQAATHARGSLDSADYRAALAWYGGELLPDDRYEDWAAAPRETVRGIYCALLRAVATLYEEAGEDGAAIEALERLVAEETTDEPAHLALMRLYARVGIGSAALRQYNALRETLARELDAEPGLAARSLYAELVTGHPTTEATATQQRSAARVAAHPVPETLPATLTSFVGREAELTELRALLVEDGVRLLTLTGVGGGGKTRLAAVAAGAVRAHYPGGVWFVNLAALPAQTTVQAAVAEVALAALGSHVAHGHDPLTALKLFFRSRRALLLLDNCEHVIAAATELTAALLSTCPGLHILATSRETLRVPGEFVWQVPPLALPPLGQEARTPEQLAALAVCPAVALFLDRARRRAPTLTLTVENAGAIVAICRQLDGLPLALELAASRIGILTIGRLAERLGDALSTLTSRERGVSPRQQTMRATLDWSYALLTEAEQRCFRALAVFVGSWSLGAAEAIIGAGAGEEATLAAIEGLVEKSLVMLVVRDDETRYRFLEPVRQYAAMRLAEAGEALVFGARHTIYYLALVAGAEDGMVKPERERWVTLLGEEIENIRAVLDRCHVQGDVRNGFILASELWRFWMVRSWHSEGRRWLEIALAGVSLEDPLLPLLRRLAVPFGAAVLAFQQADVATAARLMARVLTLARANDEQYYVAGALMQLGSIALHSTDIEQARARYAESLTLRRTLGDRWGEGISLQGLASVILIAGDVDEALPLFRQALAIQREISEWWQVATTLYWLGRALLEHGDYDDAERCLEEGVTLANAIGSAPAASNCLLLLACRAIQRGELALARARLAEVLDRTVVSGFWLEANLSIQGFALLATFVGDHPRALRLLGAAEAQSRTLKLARLPHTLHTQLQAPQQFALARAILGEAASDAAYMIGATLSLEGMVAEALALAIV